jgi:hypothetical protein
MQEASAVKKLKKSTESLVSYRLIGMHVLCGMCMATDMRAWMWCSGNIVNVQYGLTKNSSTNV